MWDEVLGAYQLVMGFYDPWPYVVWYDKPMYGYDNFSTKHAMTSDGQFDVVEMLNDAIGDFVMASRDERFLSSVYIYPTDGAYERDLDERWVTYAMDERTGLPRRYVCSDFESLDDYWE